MAEHTHEHHDRHHAHQHAHEKTVQVGNVALEISSHMHDQAATVSATVRVAEGQAFSFSRLVEVMGAIARKAEATGGIVGHIKGYAEGADGFAHASCTDAALGVNVEGNADLALGAEAKVQLVAIVMLVDLDDLERIVVEAFSQ